MDHILLTKNTDVSNIIGCTLVLVHIQLTVGANFNKVMDHLCLTRKLDCIFIDECHTLITFELFQKVLYPVNSLRRFNVPIIFMTGTLPPMFEQILRERYHLDPWVVKMSPNKSNIGYRIKLIDQNGVIDDRCMIKNIGTLLELEKPKKGD